MSAVIASVILLAAGLAIVIAVSYWLGGISSQYTGFEKVEIDYGYCATSSAVTNAGWEITLRLRNSGPQDAAFINVFVNSRPVDEYGVTSGGSLATNTSIGTSMPQEGLTLASGASDTMSIWVGSGLFSSGTSLEVNLLSSSGMNYFKQVKLS